MATTLNTSTMKVTVEGDELVIDILTPLVEGTKGRHSIYIMRSAMGDLLATTLEGRRRFLELVTPHLTEEQMGTARVIAGQNRV